MEALKKWDGAKEERSGGPGGEGLPPKIFGNRGANLHSLVHFWQPKQKKMYNSSV